MKHRKEKLLALHLTSGQQWNKIRAQTLDSNTQSLYHLPFLSLYFQQCFYDDNVTGQFTTSRADTIGEENIEHRELVRNLIFVQMLLYSL